MSPILPSGFVNPGEFLLIRLSSCRSCFRLKTCPLSRYSHNSIYFPHTNLAPATPIELSKIYLQMPKMSRRLRGGPKLFVNILRLTNPIICPRTYRSSPLAAHLNHQYYVVLHKFRRWTRSQHFPKAPKDSIGFDAVAGRQTQTHRAGLIIIQIPN